MSATTHKRQRVSRDSCIPEAAAKISVRMLKRLKEEHGDEGAGGFHKTLDKDLKQVQADTQVALAVPKPSGGDFDFIVCEPAAILQFLVQSSSALQQAYESALERLPSTCENPWRIICSFDEFTPGAQLTGRHDRKYMHLVFNFLELGQQTLTMQDTWASVVVAMLCACSRLAWRGRRLRSRADASQSRTVHGGPACV